MKKTVFISTLSSLMVASSLFASSAFAQTYAQPTTVPAGAPIAGARAALRADRQAVVADVRKAAADKELDRRITALNALITRVNAIQRISVDQKSSLVAQIQTNINELTTLKAKIDADTDAATLKTDKQSIVTQYRIFALLMPKVEIMAHADAILQLATQMSANSATFQTTIQQSGKDVSSIQSIVTDRQAKIADAITQAQNAISAVSALTPTGYPANKATLESARTMLQTARKDLRTAQQDLSKGNQGFKALK